MAADPHGLPSAAELAFKVHFGEPQQREYETPDAEPEHDDDHLAKSKIPGALGEVHGCSRQQVDVPDNREGQQPQHQYRAEVTEDARPQESEPADLCNEERDEPDAPPAKCWSFRRETHCEI